MFSFCFFCKTLYCFHSVQGLGEGSRVVRKLPSGCRGASGKSLDITGAPERQLSSRGSEPCLRASLSKKYSPNPARGQPACRRCWSGGLPSSRTWLSVSHRGGGLCGQNSEHPGPKGLVPVLLREKGGFQSFLDFPDFS